MNSFLFAPYLFLHLYKPYYVRQNPKVPLIFKYMTSGRMKGQAFITFPGLIILFFDWCPVSGSQHTQKLLYNKPNFTLYIVCNLLHSEFLFQIIFGFFFPSCFFFKKKKQRKIETAYILSTDTESASAALEATHGFKLNGKYILVQFGNRAPSAK
jgi:hypothetical protein